VRVRNLVCDAGGCGCPPFFSFPPLAAPEIVDVGKWNRIIFPFSDSHNFLLFSSFLWDWRGGFWLFRFC